LSFGDQGGNLKGKLFLLVLLAIIVPVVAYLLVPRPGSTVSISSLYNSNLQAGETIAVNVTVADVSDMTSLRVNLAWDPTVLRVTTGDHAGWRDEITGVYYDIYEGDFLKSLNATIFLVNEVNNVAGNITAIYDAITSKNATASGSGVVAIINFTCVTPGSTSIRIVGPRSGHSSLQSSSGDQIIHSDVDGVVTPSGPPGIWTELWFQVTVIVIVLEIIFLVGGVLLARRWWRSRVGQEREEEATLQDLVRQTSHLLRTAKPSWHADYFIRILAVCFFRITRLSSQTRFVNIALRL
jgi:hypothetical protein